ncbi:hypothetical protein J2S37_000584 [Corynebacterium felinum]|uniref:Uncharacterized protein n=1 Tax=Corynebacterium felinum TaxID=131318 RepID=A0ABU2B5Z5_9CORY|nr:hypothetical protein [Corynebacterium felinum]
MKNASLQPFMRSAICFWKGLTQIFHGVGLVVVGWGGVFVGLVGSPSPFDSWFLGQGVRP